MAQCLTPFLVKLPNKDEQPVPCGKCPNCLKRRVSGWSFRLMQEYKRCEFAHFITLTYDSKHVPISSKGFMVLSKTDCQRFFKRLRKEQAKQRPHLPIRYYLAGEYGTKTNRPHYHLILFNALPELISPAWNLGSVHFGEVNEASIGYTLKYMCKPGRIPLHQNDDRIKEFSLMSKDSAATT